MSDKKRFRLGDAVVNVCSMAIPLAEEVVSISSKALEEEINEQEVAANIKKQLREKFPAETWQIFVGRNFGCFVTHEEGKYIYFYIGQTGVCVYAA